MRECHDSTEAHPASVIATERRAAILALAQDELRRGVRTRRRRRVIGAAAGVVGVVALALVVATAWREPERETGLDGLADGSVDVGVEDGKVDPAGRSSGRPGGGTSQDPSDAPAHRTVVVAAPSGARNIAVPPPQLPSPDAVAGHRGPLIEIVRRSTPSPGVVSIVDDREFESLLRGLEHPVGLAVIGGEARLISSAR